MSEQIGKYFSVCDTCSKFKLTESNESWETEMVDCPNCKWKGCETHIRNDHCPKCGTEFDTCCA